MANGLGFVAGAVAGYVLLRNALRPNGGHLLTVAEVRTILVTATASLLAGLVAYLVDVLTGMQRLTAYGGGAGSLLRLVVLAVIMVPIVAVVMVRAQVPEAVAALAVLRRWIGLAPAGGKPSAPAPPPAAVAPPSGRSASVAAPAFGGTDQLLRSGIVTYPEHSNPSGRADRPAREPIRRGRPEQQTGEGTGRESAMTDGSPDSTSTKAVSDAPSSPADRRRRAHGPADDFHPDVPTDLPIDPVATPDPSTPTNGGSSDSDLETTAFAAGDPIEFDPPNPADSESSAQSDEQHLVPGASIARGRYRLLVFHGGAPHLQFWQALDTALNRQVALTFVDPDGSLPDEQIREILARTMKLSRIDKLGIARILDVVHTGTGGLVVTEWVRGGSLQEVADTSPSAAGASRAMQTLAAAAEAAHHAGVALSIDHPGRVRVSIEGDVVLAFPATMPDISPEDDIRGIGAALYALLVNKWPLPESGEPSGLAPAPRDSSGQPLDPSAIDGDIPFQIAAAATHSIQLDGGIRSAATLLNLLQQATVVADRTELLAPINENTPPPEPARPDREPAPGLDEAQARLRRRRAITIGVSAGAAVILVALLVLASVLSRMFSDVGGLDKDQLGLNGPSASSSGEGAAAGSLVKPVGATVYSPGGEADNPASAALAIDGSPGTSWETDTYHDPVPFPGFKSGVGLMLQLPQSTVVGAVNVDLPSNGTKIQIRSSATATPAQARGHRRAEPADLNAPGAQHDSRSTRPRPPPTCWCGFRRSERPTGKAAPASPKSPCKPSPDRPAPSEVPGFGRLVTVRRVGFAQRIRQESPEQRSDAELLAAHVAGDRFAFAELFHRHHRQLHRVARLTSRCTEDAEDALQEAMVSAHRARRRIPARRRGRQLAAPHRRQCVPGSVAPQQDPPDHRARRCLPGAGPDRAGRDGDRGAAGADAAARRAAGRGGSRRHARLFGRRHRPAARCGGRHGQESLRAGPGPAGRDPGYLQADSAPASSGRLAAPSAR